MRTAAAGAVLATSAYVSDAQEKDGCIGVSTLTAAGASRSNSCARVKSVIRRESTVLRYGGNGDNWHMSWGADDRQYVNLCDGGGFSAYPKAFYNSRMFAVSGGPRDARFHDVPGYPIIAAPAQKPIDPRYYAFGVLALDGRLYQFLSTLNRAMQPSDMEARDPKHPMRFVGAKLIYSPDNGINWHNHDGSTPVMWEPWERRSRDTMIFFEEDQEAFSLITVLQMGKNYEHNRDGYVYIYAPNGNTEGTMNELVMCRVKKTRILDRSSYEYYGGTLSKSTPRWSKDINARKPVHTFPRGWVNRHDHPYAWQPSVVYNAPLNLYMMASWGMGAGSDGMWFTKPSYLGLWVAEEPWGPWTQVHEETEWLPAGDKNARAYQPQIAPKWIAPDGRSFWLVWTDYQGADNPELRLFWEEYRRKREANVLGEADVGRSAAMMRRYMPYYAFNAQRVDVIVA